MITSEWQIYLFNQGPWNAIERFGNFIKLEQLHCILQTKSQNHFTQYVDCKQVIHPKRLIQTD